MRSLCEVCHKRKSVGVASVPGVPMSVAYCRHCLLNDLQPMEVLIAHTACGGESLATSISWWRLLVIHNLLEQGCTLQWFNSQVLEYSDFVNELMES
jgi:hypothetical protein